MRAHRKATVTVTSDHSAESPNDVYLIVIMRLMKGITFWFAIVNVALVTI